MKNDEELYRFQMRRFRQARFIGGVLLFFGARKTATEVLETAEYYLGQAKDILYSKINDKSKK